MTLTHTTHPSVPWYRHVAARWPAALAVVMTVLTFGGAETVDGMRSFAEILPMLPLLYVVVATLERRRATWPLVVVGFSLVFLLRGLDLISPAVVFWAIALVTLVWTGVGGGLWRDGVLQAQAVGMLVFGGLGLAGLIIDPDVGRYLVAAGWLFHGVWDVVHLKLDKVVARSFAEWCAIIDVVIGIELLLKL